MDNVLMILEVSKKQDYIFSSKKLQVNAARSAIISYVTGNEFFKLVASKVYQEKENMIYSGGGHTVLQFPNAEQATEFARIVSESAMRDYDGLEIFIKQMPYDNSKTQGENMKELTKQLERKKSLRENAFRLMSFGVEKLDSVTFLPKCSNVGKIQAPAVGISSVFQPISERWIYPSEFSELAGDDNFIAVVHIDGNSMGKRVEGIYEEKEILSWDEFCRVLRQFSEGIQQDFESAFSETVDELIADLPADKKILPIRPVILAGDDVCFVTAGDIGLECARIFLKKLATKKNAADGQGYSACAGVALVHQKYPFHQAYDLSEELCSNAKKYGASLDADGRISAIDWHIEFGQLKGGLSELREEYQTEDGNQLSLRPLTVLVPDGIQHDARRTYDFFRVLCRKLQGEYGKVARSKIKELREAFKQGEIESRFFFHDKEISELLWRSLEARYQDAASNVALLEENLATGNRKLDKDPFQRFPGEENKRCLFFDSIEMIDHFTPIEEVRV